MTSAVIHTTVRQNPRGRKSGLHTLPASKKEEDHWFDSHNKHVATGVEWFYLGLTPPPPVTLKMIKQQRMNE